MVRKLLLDRLVFVLKYFIGLFLLAWILWRVDRQQLLDTIISIDIKTMAITLFFSISVITLQYQRWKFLVKSNSINFNKKDLLPAFFAGFAFRMILPGGHAEITKVFLMPGKKSGKVLAFGLEKFLETYFKFLLVFAAVPYLFSSYGALWYLTAVGVAALFFLPYMLRSKLIQRFHEKETEHNKTVTFTLLYSAIVFLGLCLEYFYLINGSYSISFFNTIITVIFIWGAGLIPISVSGVGVRENVAVILFSRFGLPDSAAVGYSLLIFSFNTIIPALIGAFFIYRKRAHLSDVKGAIKTAYQNNKESFKFWKNRKN
jgi:uncharacterized membrane protein YbhN (UPF0104 family)